MIATPKEKSGFLLIDKPAGLTSHDVINRLRRLTGVRRIGHAGTLDPFATGLLVVGVGREATRELGMFSGQDKTYEATMQLGAISDTQDLDGTITETPNAQLPSENSLRQTMATFVGNIKQTPPMYSAKKIRGQKLYELARAGITVDRAPVDIVVASLELLETTGAPDHISSADFRVHCSSGTYVRTLAHDLGQALGCGAYLSRLRRATIGDLNLTSAVQLNELTPENWASHLIPIKK